MTYTGGDLCWNTGLRGFDQMCPTAQKFKIDDLLLYVWNMNIGQKD